jgi:hypothetical protein
VTIIERVAPRWKKACKRYVYEETAEQVGGWKEERIDPSPSYRNERLLRTVALFNAIIRRVPRSYLNGEDV